MQGSATDTPEEITIDPAERGGAAWMAKCEKEIGTEEGVQRVKTFVRRFKRKGGEDGGPGDLDALHADLVAIMFADEQEAADELRNFLEGDGAWDICGSTFSSAEQEEKIRFMNVLNRIKWIPDNDPTVAD